MTLWQVLATIALVAALSVIVGCTIGIALNAGWDAWERWRDR